MAESETAMPQRHCHTSMLRDERGSLLVELALIAPMLVLITVATIDFGRILWVDTTLEPAAKESSRFASIRGAESFNPATNSDIDSFARSRAVGVDPGGLTVTVTWSPNNSSGSAVRVRLSYQYEFLLGSLLPLDPLQLEGAASYVVL